MRRIAFNNHRLKQTFKNSRSVNSKNRHPRQIHCIQRCIRIIIIMIIIIIIIVIIIIIIIIVIIIVILNMPLAIPFCPVSVQTVPFFFSSTVLRVSVIYNLFFPKKIDGIKLICVLFLYLQNLLQELGEGGDGGTRTIGQDFLRSNRQEED